MNIFNSEFGKRLKDARKKANLNLEEAAKATNITKQMLIKYEKHGCNSSLKNFKKLCDVYSVSADYLLYGIQEKAEIKTSLGRKVYYLAALDLEKDISYDSVRGIISFKNDDLKHFYSYCHSMFVSSNQFTQLEIIEKILKYIDGIK